MHAHNIGTVPVLCCIKSQKTIDSYCCGYTAVKLMNMETIVVYNKLYTISFRGGLSSLSN